MNDDPFNFSKPKEKRDLKIRRKVKKSVMVILNFWDLVFFSIEVSTRAIKNASVWARKKVNNLKSKISLDEESSISGEKSDSDDLDKDSDLSPPEVGQPDIKE